MRYPQFVALGLAILLPSVASGVVMTFFDDPQKERGIAAAQLDPKVQALRVEFDALARRMQRWKKRDFEALFGAPVQGTHTDYALTCTQPRTVWMSGLRLNGPDSKAHTAAYTVADGVRVDVSFQWDGVTPSYMLFYLRTGKGFVRLDRADQLEARVAWEREILWKTAKRIDSRWGDVVGWEVDGGAFATIFAGREAIDLYTKFQAYREWGEKQELRLVCGKGSWEWYRGKTRVAHAYGDDDVTPTNFVLFGADGQSVRDHLGGTKSYSIRWNRPDGSNARYESWERDGDSGPWRAVGWVWSGPGGHGKRSEMDTNGDGIPDEVQQHIEGKEAATAPLTVEQSWAIHPKLIPADWRVTDQPDRRLPVRRITK